MDGKRIIDRAAVRPPPLVNRRIEAVTSRLPRLRGPQVRSLLLLAAALAIGLVGLRLVRERPGLLAEYFSLTTSWVGGPVYTRIEPPALADRRELGRVLYGPELASVRWRGWILVDRAGAYRLAVEADESAYLSIDGRPVVGDGAGAAKGEVLLERGIHAIEIGLVQSGGEARLEVLWAPPGGPQTVLPAALLFAERPGPLDRFFRAATLLPNLVRRLLGGLLMVAALALMRYGARLGRDRKPRRPVARRGSSTLRRIAAAAALAALLAGVFLAVYPFTAGLYGFDDVRYLDVAHWSKSVPWILNRYAHVYLLKAFIWLRGGDPFLASRTWWSAVFCSTLAAMAVAAGALARGPGGTVGAERRGRPLARGLPTLGAAILLLFSQPVFFLGIGAAYSDYAAMLWVTAGVALYLHGLGRRRSFAAWHSLLLGAFTVLAFKSKETGIILLWPALLMALERGRLDLRRWARRLLLWIAGAAAALALLACLDGVVLGDPLFGLRPSHMREVGQLNFAPEPQQARGVSGWLQILWSGSVVVNRGDRSVGYVGLLVLLAAAVATLRGRSMEIRLLHLMPILFLLMLIALHARATYVFLPRYLFPILPTSCLLAGTLFDRRGIEDLKGRDLLAPGLSYSAAGVLLFMLLIVLPFQAGRISARDLVPMEALSQIGWESAEEFLQSTLFPLALLTGLAAAALLFRRRGAPTLVLALAVALLLGPYLQGTLHLLDSRRAAQRAELILYPLKIFRSDLAAAYPGLLVASPLVVDRLEMLGSRATCQRIARLYLDRRGFRVRVHPVPGAKADYGLGTLEDLERWRVEKGLPEAAVRLDPTGRIGLAMLGSGYGERP